MPPSALRDTLQTSLGTVYNVERELGGGGMSRAFVAEENALGRKVVVKILAPELAEGISSERFAREIRLAATLQQANIVPLLSTGEVAGLPYYTMSYVDGQSLRARCAMTAHPRVRRRDSPTASSRTRSRAFWRIPSLSIRAWRCSRVGVVIRWWFTI